MEMAEFEKMCTTLHTKQGVDIVQIATESSEQYQKRSQRTPFRLRVPTEQSRSRALHGPATCSTMTITSGAVPDRRMLKVIDPGR